MNEFAGVVVRKFKIPPKWGEGCSTLTLGGKGTVTLLSPRSKHITETSTKHKI
jgi:hypothetical protein